jgi:hypothetical protein
MGDGLKDIRDRALLMMGFAGALRRASDAMLARYIREGELFGDNAAGALL